MVGASDVSGVVDTMVVHAVIGFSISIQSWDCTKYTTYEVGPPAPK